MLSPREDDDDDTHLCIKCNTTILGLENYVKHRKERCGKKTENKDLPPIDTLDPTYSLGADVFFQSLELQSSVKKTVLSRLTPPIPATKPCLDRKSSLAIPSSSRAQMSPLESNLRGEDWIGGHTLRISGTEEDNQTKLINAVASISGAAKKETNSSYTIGYSGYKPDEDSDESEVFEEDDDEDNAKWKPPPNYTGGKWRPASPDHDWDDQEPSASWKTLLPEVDRDEDYDAPPPGHTKGKWVPGANEKTQIMQTTIQTKGSVQYWCGPCNRRLGSRAIYEKHLRSSLHLKKVLPEHELEFAGHIEPIKSVQKRAARPSKFVNDGIYTQVERKRRQKGSKLTVKIEAKKRKRKSYFVHCAGCKSRVREHLMGKHLISHYHFRKAAGVTNSLYQQLILDNIDAIVHQSPFQCSPCKFYTNWLSTFMQHWYSEEHEWTMTFIDGIFWCSFCKYECKTSQEMLLHLTSSEHSEVVAVINRSMPIIIRKKTVLKCETCSEVFRFNIELKKHSQKTGHPLAYTATDVYQELHQCQQCKAKFKSSLTLAAHLKSKHKQKPHLCLVCSKTFDSSEEAKHHRQTSEHRVNRKEMLMQQGVITKDLRKRCPYCPGNIMMKNILVLKDHIRSFHPDIRKTCPKCGMEFILSQEVTSHIRTNACRFQDSSRINSSVFWSCSQCLFTTDSQAESYFHEVLHESPTKFKKPGSESMIEKYSCPICQKFFKKASLRQHLRQHTFERPFVCSICRANFTRQTSLSNHVRCEHGDAVKVPEVLTAVERDEWRCEKCMKRFPNKTVLSRHACEASASTDRKCHVVDCTFIATSSLQLAKHQRSHGLARSERHKCPHCPFKSSQSNHLKRHLQCHKGDKPYACPHCEFTCGSLENLRKHVLRSGRHKDVFLYLCKHCDYQNNMATEFRTHLTTVHSTEYNAKTAVQTKESRTDVQFHLAALRGDCDRLRQLLDTGKVHIDSRDRDGTTPLILSAAMGHTECVRELLQQGADPACCRTTGTSALFFAAQGGFLDIARLLLENGAAIDAPSTDGGTPLFVACQCGHLPVVEELIRRGANVNSCMKDKASPLFIAAQNGHEDVCRALLQAGARVDAARADGASPLWITAQCGHQLVARELLRAGASVDLTRQDGATPLFKAAHKGHAAVVAELLKYKPNLGLLPNGQTALHGACMFGQMSCVRLLARRTPAVRSAAGLTPAQAARHAARHDVLAYLNSLHTTQ